MWWGRGETNAISGVAWELFREQHRRRAATRTSERTAHPCFLAKKIISSALPALLCARRQAGLLAGKQTLRGAHSDSHVARASAGRLHFGKRIHKSTQATALMIESDQSVDCVCRNSWGFFTNSPASQLQREHRLISPPANGHCCVFLKQL